MMSEITKVENASGDIPVRSIVNVGSLRPAESSRVRTTRATIRQLEEVIPRALVTRPDPILKESDEARQRGVQRIPTSESAPAGSLVDEGAKTLVSLGQGWNSPDRAMQRSEVAHLAKGATAVGHAQLGVVPPRALGAALSTYRMAALLSPDVADGAALDAARLYSTRRRFAHTLSCGHGTDHTHCWQRFRSASVMFGREWVSGTDLRLSEFTVITELEEAMPGMGRIFQTDFIPDCMASLPHGSVFALGGLARHLTYVFRNEYREWLPAVVQAVRRSGREGWITMTDLEVRAVRTATTQDVIGMLGAGASKGDGPITCHGCGQEGHLKRDCPDKTKNRDDYRRRMSVLVCDNCGDVGHFKRNCPWSEEQAAAINALPPTARQKLALASNALADLAAEKRAEVLRLIAGDTAPRHPGVATPLMVKGGAVRRYDNDDDDEPNTPAAQTVNGGPQAKQAEVSRNPHWTAVRVAGRGKVTEVVAGRADELPPVTQPKAQTPTSPPDAVAVSTSTVRSEAATAATAPAWPSGEVIDALTKGLTDVIREAKRAGDDYATLVAAGAESSGRAKPEVETTNAPASGSPTTTASSATATTDTAPTSGVVSTAVVTTTSTASTTTSGSSSKAPAASAGAAAAAPATAGTAAASATTTVVAKKDAVKPQDELGHIIKFERTDEMTGRRLAACLCLGLCAVLLLRMDLSVSCGVYRPPGCSQPTWNDWVPDQSVLCRLQMASGATTMAGAVGLLAAVGWPAWLFATLSQAIITAPAVVLGALASLAAMPFVEVTSDSISIADRRFGSLFGTQVDTWSACNAAAWVTDDIRRAAYAVQLWVVVAQIAAAFFCWWWRRSVRYQLLSYLNAESDVDMRPIDQQARPYVLAKAKMARYRVVEIPLGLVSLVRGATTLWSKEVIISTELLAELCSPSIGVDTYNIVDLKERLLNRARVTDRTNLNRGVLAANDVVGQTVMCAYHYLLLQNTDRPLFW